MAIGNNALQGWQTAWNALFQAGGWIMTTVGGFAVAPPASIQDNGKTWYAFGQFAAAVLIGLAVGFREMLPRRRWLVLIVALLLLLALALVVTYQYQFNSRTCTYEGQTVVMGSVYTEAGKPYEKSVLTPELILPKFGGKAELVWTRESINENRTILALYYMACVMSCTLCMAAVVQVPFSKP
jgi:hypothetical protein